MEHAPVADRTSTTGTALPDAPQLEGSETPAASSSTAVERCPVDHGALSASIHPSTQSSTPSDATVAGAMVSPPRPVDGCPVDHAGLVAELAAPMADDAGSRCLVPHVVAAASAAGCPVAHHRGPIRRSKADVAVRRLLRIRERPAGVTRREVYAAFQKSMLISATRCTLTYVVFPFVLPAIGIALEGLIGVLVGSVAMVADVFTIRRFFAVDHKWRWYLSAIVFGIMCLLTALLVQDVSHLVR